MLKWFRQLDTILRGDATTLESLRKGRIDLHTGGILAVAALLAVFYGLCCGMFAVINAYSQGLRISDSWLQLLSSGIKFPLLFYLTLLITFPSLYVFNALVGSRLSIVSVLRLLIAAMGVTLAVIASLGTIVIFFSISTQNYSFMVLLNVLVCAVGGFLGMAFLLRTLHRLVLMIDSPQSQTPSFTQRPVVSNTASTPTAQGQSPIDPPTDKPAEPNSALELVGPRTNIRAKRVIQTWTCVFALVGAQMSWVLRPFIGNPELPFQFLRPRESNFFEAVLRTLSNLFS